MDRFGLAFFRACLLAVAGCAGVYLPPAANVPALRSAGQATLGVSARLFRPHTAAHALAAVAVTKQLRLASTLSGAFARRTRRGIYGELLAGAEPMLTKRLQLGVLAGAGYGHVAVHDACQGSEVDEEGNV